MEEYTAAVREVCGRVLELIVEDLGVDRSLTRAMVVGREGSDELVRVNHYPPCPLLPPVDCGVTGFGEHTDPQIISVLRSNRTAGLQIKLRDGRWVPVPPAPESFVVNARDGRKGDVRNDHNALGRIKSTKIAILGKHQKVSASVRKHFQPL